MTSNFKSSFLAIGSLWVCISCPPSFSVEAVAVPSLAQAPVLPGGALRAAPIENRQAPINPGTLPTDITPIGIGQERNLFSPGIGFWLAEKLPSRMWFTFSTEVSQRLETNIFASYHRPVSDYVFRALPNLSIGYNIFKNTSIYSNYFAIKDVYANHPLFTAPTTQSLSVGIRQYIPVGKKSSIQLDFQSRELWQISHLRQADLLPSITVTHAFTPNVIGFGNTTLQMRGQHFFQGPSREIDPFYSLGVLYRRGKWTFSATDTLVTNFRYHDAIPRQSNISMIADLEATYPLLAKVPGLVSFVRAEPIFNYNKQKLSGLSGVDFRLFGGLRYSASKPSYGADLDRMRDYINETNSPRQTSQRLHNLLASIEPSQSDFQGQLGRVGWLPRISDFEDAGTVNVNPSATPLLRPEIEIDDQSADVRPKVNCAGMLPQW